MVASASMRLGSVAPLLRQKLVSTEAALVALVVLAAVVAAGLLGKGREREHGRQARCREREHGWSPHNGLCQL